MGGVIGSRKGTEFAEAHCFVPAVHAAFEVGL